MKNFLSFVIVGILVFFVTVIWKDYYYKPSVEVVEIVRVDTVYITDTIIKTKLVPKYVTLPNDTIYIPANIDSLVALYTSLYTEFNTRRTYFEDFDLDTLGVIMVSASVFRNSLDSLEVRPLLTLPLTTITREIYKTKNTLYGGFNVGKNNFSPSLLYTTPKYNVSLQYNIIEKQIGIGIGYKIFNHGTKLK
jgi:hypothetical protein